MVYRNFDELIQRIDSMEPKCAVLVCAHDEHALKAVVHAAATSNFDYLLVGDKEKIVRICEEKQLNLDYSKIVEADGEQDAAVKSVQLIREGKGDFLMKGKMQTASLLSQVVKKDTGIRTGEKMSHLSLVEIPGYHKLIGITDCGMALDDGLEMKRCILQNAVGFMNSLGYENPKVGMLCAIENVNEKMPETVIAQTLKEEAMAGKLNPCTIEGPISYDLLMSKESAQIKGYESNVCGDADLLVVPNMVSGNLLIKCMLITAKGVMAGCILGAKVPIILTSRGASAREKYLSMVMAAAYKK